MAGSPLATANPGINFHGHPTATVGAGSRTRMSGKNMKTRTVSRLSCALVAIAALGCAEDYNFTEPERKFEVSPSFIGIEEGTTTQLEATFDGEPVAVTWASDDPSILTVSSSGLVTGVRGTATTAAIATLVSDPTQKSAASVTVISLPILESGVPLTGLANPTPGVMTVYKVIVPQGATNLTVTMAGGSGDADLYVRFGSPPNPDDFDCRPFAAGNDEECSFDSPAAGTWFIGIEVFEAYADASLTATVTP